MAAVAGRLLLSSVSGCQPGRRMAQQRLWPAPASRTGSRFRGLLATSPYRRESSPRGSRGLLRPGRPQRLRRTAFLHAPEDGSLSESLGFRVKGSPAASSLKHPRLGFVGSCILGSVTKYDFGKVTFCVWFFETVFFVYPWPSWNSL